MIVFLHCSTNNKAVNFFDYTLNDFGTPSKIWTVTNGEHFRIRERMTESRRENPVNYLAGSSVHNQQIERLWRDMWYYVYNEFHYLFQAKEDQGTS